MILKTVEGVLHPDGRVSRAALEMPLRSVRVMVTLLADDEDESLAEFGDYAMRLEEFEERHAARTIPV